MKKNEEPKFYKVIRIIGFSALPIGVLLIILGCVVFRNDTFGQPHVNFALLIPGIICIFSSIPCLFIGFFAKIQKMQIKSLKYLQESCKDDLTDIANTSADISDEAITKTARAIKTGFKDSMFCKHCGAEIDKDSKFCKECGKEQ